MKITCDVICDLLPVYAEGLASRDTAALVEQHLPACEACTAALKELQTPLALSADTDTAGLRQVRSKINRQKTRAIMLTALLCLVVAITLFGWLSAPEYLPYSVETVKLTVHENHRLSLRFGPEVTGYDIERLPSETGAGEELHITAWTSLLGRMMRGNHTQEVFLNPDGQDIAAAYYYTAYGTDHQWLYGKGDENVVLLPRLFLSYYFTLALALAVVLLISVLLLRRHQKSYRALWYAAIAPVSYLLAHLCIKGSDSMTYAPLRDLSLIVLVALPIYGLLFMAVRWHIKREEKRCR